MVTITWHLHTHRGQHTIRLEHTFLAGLREIWVDDVFVDNASIERGKKFLDLGSRHTFLVDDEACEIIIAASEFHFDYFLVHGGMPVPSDEQLEKGVTPEELMRGHTAFQDTNFWLELAELLNLPYLANARAALDSRHRLIGTRDGYLVLIEKRKAKAKKQFVWYVAVHHTEEHSDGFLDRIRADERTKRILGKDSKRKSILDRNASSVWMNLPSQEGETPGTLAQSILAFVTVVAENTRPIPTGCGRKSCRHREGKAVKLVMFKDVPQFMCEDCIDLLLRRDGKTRLAYQSAPENLLPGAAAGAAAAFVGAVAWTAAFLLFNIIGPGISILVSMGILWAMRRAGAKLSRRCLLVAFALTLFSVTLGNLASSLVVAVAEGLPLNAQTAWFVFTGLFKDHLLYVSYFLTAFGAGLYLFSHMQDQTSFEERLYLPRVEVLPGEY